MKRKFGFVLREVFQSGLYENEKKNIGLLSREVFELCKFDYQN